MSLSLPGTGVVHGSTGIKAHYDYLHNLADEQLDIINLVMEGNNIFYENKSWFKFKETPSTDNGPHHGLNVKKGDVLMV